MDSTCAVGVIVVRRSQKLSEGTKRNELDRDEIETDRKSESSSSFGANTSSKNEERP